MNAASTSSARCASLLAINLLFLMIWGFASVSKIRDGVPSWFGDKFGQTFLAHFPGLAATFWLLTAAETAACGLALVALLRGEFLGGRATSWLTSMLVWSLFVFLQLGFGQWLTSEFNGAFQQFVYFGVTLVALQHVSAATSKSTPQDGLD
jgi:hypothetical protein